MRDELIPDTRRLAGIVTVTELLGSGLSKDDIRSMVRRGVIKSARHGIYVRTDLAERISDKRIIAIAAAVAQVGHCVASHQDAALIQGLDLLERPAEQAISVSRSHRFGPNGRKVGHHGRPTVRIHAVPTPRSHLAIHNQVLVTSVARTVIDVARITPFRAGVVTADSALHQKKTTKDEMRAVIAVMSRWPGIAKARDVVDFADGRAESPFESVARVAFRDAGLPPPKLQLWISDGYSMVGRVDFCWPEHKTIAEADGAAKYADPAKARHQLQRDTELRDAGYQVVHFTWWELERGPALVIGRIRTAFQRNAGARAR